MPHLRPNAGRILPAPELPVSRNRRGFLRRAALMSGGAIAAVHAGRAFSQDDAGANLPPNVPEWSKSLGAPILANPYGLPSKFEANVRRRESPGLTRTAQSSVAFTPLQNLFGVITPAGLHFERHHAGVPEIDPHQHRLMIHGMVRSPRIFTMDDLMRFPAVSRLHFLECGANTGMEWGNVAVPTVQYTHGMLGCSRRAMPFPNPKTLTSDEVYALTAYVLNLNDILPADAALDRKSLVRLRMPNRDGFTTDHGFMRRDGKPDTHNTACMQDCVAVIRLSSEIPGYARDAHGDLADQMRRMGPVEGIRTGAVSSHGSAPDAPSIASRGPEAARKAGCMACHSVASKVVGPAFKDVAARCAGDAEAQGKLVAKIRAGGAGAWGAVPMPAQPQVKESDSKAVVQWILSGAK